MTTYRHSYCTRSVPGICTALGYALLLVLAGELFPFWTGKQPGIVVYFWLLPLFGFIWSTYRLISPVTWSIQVTDDDIRWDGPDESRAILIAEIIEARAIDGSDTIADTFEITLSSGDSVRVPRECMGDFRAVLAALKAARPAIRLFYDGHPVTGFVDHGWAGWEVLWNEAQTDKTPRKKPGA